jgi:hypothetical protein
LCSRHRRQSLKRPQKRVSASQRKVTWEISDNPPKWVTFACCLTISSRDRPSEQGDRTDTLLLESAIAKLDKFHLLILDDITYVTKDQVETSVLFELISARYERRSMLITANQPFGEWNTIFPDPSMTLAAVDRLVHHAAIFEMNVESYRRRAAEKAKGPARPAQKETTANSKPD